MTSNDPSKEPVEPRVDESGWPSWFIEAANPIEREVLARIFQGNAHLSEVHFTVQMMQMNYLVFRRNYGEVARLCEDFDQPSVFRELALQSEKGQAIAQHTIFEFTRLRHNYLSSEKMLVDVTRRWVRLQFADSEFLDLYQAEVSKRVEKNVQAQFLEDLRNFALHRVLPLAVPELRMQKVSDKRLQSSLGIVLIKDYLLEWDGWSEIARMQIDMAFEGEVDIVSICRRYFDTVTEFNQWLYWQVRHLFSEEIDKINAAIERVRGQ